MPEMASIEQSRGRAVLGASAIVFSLVVATQGAPEGLQLVAATVRALGIAGMGAGLLLAARAPRATA